MLFLGRLTHPHFVLQKLEGYYVLWDIGQSPFLFHREPKLAENFPQCVVMPVGVGHQVGAAKVYGIRFR